MDHTLHILVLLLLILRRSILTSAAADSPMMLPSAACSDKLVTFSTCLPFIADFPNNRTDFPPPQCCDYISVAFKDGSDTCLCYFVLQPKILGFPLNSTKLLSLTSVCPMKDQNRTADFSLETICSASARLPPLRSITGPTTGHNNSQPSKSGPESPPPSLMGPAQESTGSSSTRETGDVLPSEPTISTVSSATEQVYRLGWTLLSLVYLHMSTSVQ